MTNAQFIPTLFNGFTEPYKIQLREDTRHMSIDAQKRNFRMNELKKADRVAMRVRKRLWTQRERRRREMHKAKKRNRKLVEKRTEVRQLRDLLGHSFSSFIIRDHIIIYDIIYQLSLSLLTCVIMMYADVSALYISNIVLLLFHSIFRSR